MTEDPKNGIAERWLEYLRVVQSLSAETNAAVSALAGNDLGRFESSVAEQERLCETARWLSQSLRRNPQLGTPPRELIGAGRELRQQNHVYAAVLARGAQICRALLSLYQESPRGYSPDGRTASATNTWSCEV